MRSLIIPVLLELGLVILIAVHAGIDTDKMLTDLVNCIVMLKDRIVSLENAAAIQEKSIARLLSQDTAIIPDDLSSKKSSDCFDLDSCTEGQLTPATNDDGVLQDCSGAVSDCSEANSVQYTPNSSTTTISAVIYTPRSATSVHSHGNIAVSSGVNDTQKRSDSGGSTHSGMPVLTSTTTKTIDELPIATPEVKPSNMEISSLHNIRPESSVNARSQAPWDRLTMPVQLALLRWLAPTSPNEPDPFVVPKLLEIRERVHLETSFLELDSSLKLLVVFAIFCISIALLQSDRIAAAARRGVNNAITLAVLLVDDMLAGVEMLSTSPRTHQVLQGAQRYLFKLMKAVQATVMLAIQHAEVQRRAQSVIQRAGLRSVGAAHALAGYARALLGFTLVLISIVLHVIVNYLRDFAATTDFTAIILSAGNFVLKNILNFHDLLYNVLAILGMYSATAEAWFTTYISVPALSVGFVKLTWIPLKTAATWLWSVWKTLDIFAPFKKMGQELEAVYEMVFGTGDVNGRTFGETMAPVPRPTIPKEPVTAIEGEYQSPWKDRLRKGSVSTGRH
ncbi:hypothetical protein D6C84_05887 [Aureobasidium pullulans]|uniref:Uncharacterized protein n=1 Tax=Aureobasidium pullulans TaxID=5580 RepID=A0A4S9XVS7_AURPU|nr:hypothetical protein D6C84_05887 [Aureobasidium pullulans]